MPEGINGAGFGSREEAARFHAQRFIPRATNLDYKFGPRVNSSQPREALPPSPLDGERSFQQAQATEQAQQKAMSQFLQESGQAPLAEIAEAPPKKSLKQIAMERGHIPRKD